MKSIQKLYRSTYAGEEVVSDMTYENGSWVYQRETVPNAVFNNQISNKAIVIGNGVSRKDFNLNLIKNHKGGLLAGGALQSYGCNALYREFSPHFLVVNGDEIIEEVASSGYTNDHIVYSHASVLLKYPSKFYLTPQDPSWNAGAVAAYIACFDGHKQVYLLGFDGIDDTSSGNNIYEGTNGYSTPPTYGYSEDFWVQAMLQVFTTYNNVDFVMVAPTPNFRIPELLKYVPNLRQLDFRGFALEVDL